MYTVAALYKFSSIEDPNNLQIAVRKELKQLKIYGTILVGNEGLNGTISGQDSNLKDAIEFIKSIEGFNDIDLSLIHISAPTRQY